MKWNGRVNSHSSAKPAGLTRYAAIRSGCDWESSYASCARAAIGATPIHPTTSNAMTILFTVHLRSRARDSWRRYQLVARITREQEDALTSAKDGNRGFPHGQVPPPRAVGRVAAAGHADVAGRRRSERLCRT